MEEQAVPSQVKLWSPKHVDCELRTAEQWQVPLLRLYNGGGTSRQEPVQLAKMVTAFLAVRQQLKQRRIFFQAGKAI